MFRTLVFIILTTFVISTLTDRKAYWLGNNRCTRQTFRLTFQLIEALLRRPNNYNYFLWFMCLREQAMDKWIYTCINACYRHLQCRSCVQTFPLMCIFAQIMTFKPFQRHSNEISICAFQMHATQRVTIKHIVSLSGFGISSLAHIDPSACLSTVCELRARRAAGLQPINSKLTCKPGK